MNRPHLLVVGAGPGGLASAATSAAEGCDVTLVDSAPRGGGQYYRHAPFDVAPRQEALHLDLSHGRRLLADALGNPRVSYAFGASVWSVATGEPSRAVVLQVLLADGGTAELRGDALVLATGAYDRTLPFPGWDLPGVVTPGGAQAVLKGNLVLPGRRILVAGTGPFLLPVAAGLATAGAQVAGVVEANLPRRWVRHSAAIAGNLGKLREAAHYAAILARHRVPMHFGRAVVRAEGLDEVQAAVISKVDRQWRPLPGTEQRVEVDTVAVGYGFTPSVELAATIGCALTTNATDGSVVVVADDDRASTSVPGVFAAGEITGVAGSVVAELEGRLAGLGAAAYLGLLTPARFSAATAPLRRTLRRHARFTGALDDVYGVRDGWQSWVSPDTTVCRCEEVPLSALDAAIDDLGATDLRSLKLLTRIGMGPCQGRICGPAAADLLARRTGRDAEAVSFASRPIAVPLPLGSLAAEPVDWPAVRSNGS